MTTSQSLRYSFSCMVTAFHADSGPSDDMHQHYGVIRAQPGFRQYHYITTTRGCLATPPTATVKQCIYYYQVCANDFTTCSDVSSRMQTASYVTD